MKITFEETGIVIISLFLMAIPIVCTLSFAYDWLNDLKFILMVACFVEWLGLMNLLSKIGDEE